MEASLRGSRSDSSLSSFGADSLLEAGVKAGDFLRRRVKGSSHSTPQGEGKNPVQGGQGASEQGAEKPKCPSCSLGACVGPQESLGAGWVSQRTSSKRSRARSRAGGDARGACPEQEPAKAWGARGQ